jgi:hypothetical protein
MDRHPSVAYAGGDDAAWLDQLAEKSPDFQVGNRFVYEAYVPQSLKEEGMGPEGNAEIAIIPAAEFADIQDAVRYGQPR